jgi:hypothetical protein
MHEKLILACNSICRSKRSNVRSYLECNGWDPADPDCVTTHGKMWISIEQKVVEEAHI